jgi:UDP-glucose 4-epimerase
LATYLITGVAGFLGSHLADALLSRGEDARGHKIHVRGLDNLSTGHLRNIPSAVDFIQADLADAAAVAKACLGVDAILHQAALPSVPRSVKDPRPSHTSNLDGTFNLLEGARAARAANSNHAKRILYAASSSAYGNQPGFPRVETMTPQPIAPYPVQKLAGELYMQSYARVYGMETVCLRYFNIFGPRQTPDSPYSGVIAKFAQQMLNNEPCTIQGDGEQSRDFTYIDNAISANLLALEAPADRIAGRVFNVACGQRSSLNETFRILARLTGYTQPPIYTDPRAGDIYDSLADISAARNAFGYTPLVGLTEGLARTVAWYREQLRPAVDLHHVPLHKSSASAPPPNASNAIA